MFLSLPVRRHLLWLIYLHIQDFHEEFRLLLLYFRCNEIVSSASTKIRAISAQKDPFNVIINQSPSATFQFLSSHLIIILTWFQLMNSRFSWFCEFNLCGVCVFVISKKWYILHTSFSYWTNLQPWSVDVSLYFICLKAVKNTLMYHHGSWVFDVWCSWLRPEKRDILLNINFVLFNQGHPSVMVSSVEQ